MRTRQQLTRGFTLLELTIALAVLAIASAGALAGLVSSKADLKSGQARQLMMMLVDAKAQKLLLTDKSNWWLSAVIIPGTGDPTTASFPVGTAPWAPDPSVPASNTDISAGAYFKLYPDGEMLQDTSVTAGTACNSPNLPLGDYCREIILSQGAPPSSRSPNISLIAPSRAMTYWIRISRKGYTDTLVDREVVIQ